MIDSVQKEERDQRGKKGQTPVCRPLALMPSPTRPQPCTRPRQLPCPQPRPRLTGRATLRGVGIGTCASLCVTRPCESPVLYIVLAIAAVGHHPYTSRQLGSNTFLRHQPPASGAGDSTRSGTHPVPTTCIALSLAPHVSRTPTFRQHLALCTAPPYRAQQGWHRRYTLRKASLSPPIPRHLRTMPSTMCGRPHMTSHSRR